MEGILSLLRQYDPAPLLAEGSGVDASSIRLVVCVFFAFFLSFPYKQLVTKMPSTPQHILNTVIGLSMMYYCYGYEIVHLVFDMLIVLFILKTIGGTFVSVILTWLIIFGHLLYGYYYIIVSDDVAKLDWTVSGCVLCLKLIGLVSDLYDTVQANKRGDTEGRKIPLKSQHVGVWELLGYSTLFCTCVVSPIIDFQRYVDFVNRKLYNPRTTPSSIPYGIMRFLTGVLFLGIYLYLVTYVPLDYFVSAEFASKPFVYKFFLAALLYKVAFKKYSAIWLMSEGACVVTGLSYNGQLGDGSTDWSGCAGIRVVLLDTALYTQQIINSFNLTTNEWAMQHVYKKCRFLNSKIASQSITLMFLAAFHGFLPGYFMCFGHEIIMVAVEKQVMEYGMLKVGPVSSWPLIARIILIPFGYLYHLFAMSLTLGMFQLLTLERCLIFTSALNYYTIYAYMFLLPFGKFLEIQTKKEKKRTEKKERKID